MTEDLPPRIKYWLTEEKPDCFFKVGPEDSKPIGAIKPLLKGVSEPFRVMFGDSKLAETGEIRLPDVEPETFMCFLKCVYGANNLVIPKLTFEESAKLLYIVEKYLVNDIKSELTDHMKTLISYENIFLCLSHPICYQISSLEKEIVEIVSYNFEKLTKDDKFLELSDSAISWLLQQEPIYVKEIEVWNVVLQWAKHKTGSSDGNVLRSCIFHLLKYIRFLTMDIADFRKDVVPSQILQEEEINDICKAFVLGKPCNIEHLSNNRSNRYNIKEALTNINSSIIDNSLSALIHCSINSISDLQTNVFSRSYFWAELIWCIGVGKTKSKEGENDALSIFIFCTGKTENWNCVADVEVRLVNQYRKQDTRTKRVNRGFRKSECGIRLAIYDWNALLNPVNGFVKDDTIIVEMTVDLGT